MQRGKGKTCSLRRLPGLRDEAKRTAVTLVMKDSIGSTVSLVTAMMNTSHVAFSSFSSSFLLSIWKHMTTHLSHAVMLR